MFPGRYVGTNNDFYTISQDMIAEKIKNRIKNDQLNCYKKMVHLTNFVEKQKAIRKFVLCHNWLLY